MRTEDSGLSGGITLALHGCSQAADDFGHLLGKGNDDIEVLQGDVAAIECDIKSKGPGQNGTYISPYSIK